MEDLPGLAASYCTLALTLLNQPRTVEIPRWRTENCAAVCLGSICHVPLSLSFSFSCATVGNIRSWAIRITSAETARNFKGEFSWNRFVRKQFQFNKQQGRRT